MQFFKSSKAITIRGEFYLLTILNFWLIIAHFFDYKAIKCYLMFYGIDSTTNTFQGNQILHKNNNMLLISNIQNNILVVNYYKY